MSFTTACRTWLATAALLVAGSVAGGTAATAQTVDAIVAAGEVRIGVLTGAPPFGTIDERGNPAGYDVDVANLVAEYLGRGGRARAADAARPRDGLRPPRRRRDRLHASGEDAGAGAVRGPLRRDRAPPRCASSSATTSNETGPDAPAEFSSSARSSPIWSGPSPSASPCTAGSRPTRRKPCSAPTGRRSGPWSPAAIWGFRTISPLRLPALEIVAINGVGFDKVDLAQARRSRLPGHQHPRRADRRRRRSGDRPRHRAPAPHPGGRPACARRPLARGRSRARPQGLGAALRDPGARPHRQGDRPAARGLRRIHRLYCTSRRRTCPTPSTRLRRRWLIADATC